MKRGEIYWVDLEPAVGSEANKRRPCVIVSNNPSNRAAATVTVLPITSSVKKLYPFDVYLDNVLDNPSKVQANHVRSVAKERCSRKAVANLDSFTMDAVDEALKLHLALT